MSSQELKFPPVGQGWVETSRNARGTIVDFERWDEFPHHANLEEEVAKLLTTRPGQHATWRKAFDTIDGNQVVRIFCTLDTSD